MRKATPCSLLSQQSHHSIVAVGASQRGEQMHPPHLCRAETTSPANTAPSWKQLVDEVIWHIIRKPFQKLRGSNCRQVIAHGQRATLSDPTCRHYSLNPHFLDLTLSIPTTSLSFRNTLLW